MRKLQHLLFLFVALMMCHATVAQSIANEFPVRGLCIATPMPDGIDQFVTFINEELAPRKINVLILRVDYNYQYESHPELRDSVALSKDDVKKLVAACRQHNIQLIPQINLLGHQSWASDLNPLLAVYPQFDETPHVKMPAEYKWPNPDGLYCKSYCPQHPDVHKIVFAMVDEICNVFESTAFHAGMDEVFYIGDDKCPRCGGRDKAELFANEVTRIQNHLNTTNRRLWIWGDRLIDGKSTGMGMWEASMNNTHRAVDMIPKNVMICDWHYERPDKSAVYFAMKGLDVVTCPWRNPPVAIAQAADMVKFRMESTEEMKNHFQGMVQTVWSGNSEFLDGFYGRKVDAQAGEKTDYNCFQKLFPKPNEATKETPKNQRKRK